MRTEHQVAQHLRCPLFGPEASDPVFECAYKLLKWAMQEAFNGILLPVRGLRVRFETFWKEQHPEEDSDFYEGLRLGNKAAMRIFMFLEEFAIMRPAEFYYLDRYEVEGDYALVTQRSRRLRNKKTLILVVHPRKPDDFKPPGVLELLRYLDLMINTDYVQVGVYHLPLFKSKPWVRPGMDPALVRGMVQSMMKTIPSAYPTPGAHCAECAEQKCLQVFNG